MIDLRSLFRVRSSDFTNALRYLVGGFVFVTAYAQCGPEAEPQYREVRVSVPQIEYVERVDTVVTWKERVKYVTVKAEQVATAEGGGVPDVASFCAEAVRSALNAQSDSVSEAPEPLNAPQLLLRSVRHDDGWFFSRDRLIATGPTSNGDLRQLTYNVRDGFQARTMGDSLIVQYPRSALLKQAAEYGIVAGIVLALTKVF